MSVVKLVMWVFAAYIIGNISPSILLGKAQGIDIKKEGSGNAGTTNALRVLGKKAAVITLVIDIMKGFAAVSAGMYFGSYLTGTVCALAVFCGHIWPCFYRFKGGKGVATAFGAILAVNWQLALMELAVVAIGLLVSKRMSVGSILGAALFPLLCLWLEPGFLKIGCVMALIVVIKHRANIRRLIKGEEPKMFAKKEENNEK
ncbi:MAG: acyl-phosphate glycerol 3-phosphate acyltransferase [Clostridiales bacterium]|nr:glycerol-3-phosphate 1-O-acyltransferase PlsY [Bacillota bacterium]MEE0516309.1 glycerol-3-phosphate 1-O-acyltransferase PlsY [Anaerovoracaceae bacterium]PWL94787.1 MAG: acyl-phosphate glycerol 3-phosphate acyltransferase [Clostridiales bacterium]